MESFIDSISSLKGELFSKHYLKNKIQKYFEILNITDSQSKDILNRITEKYSDYKEILEKLQEPEIEDDFLKPILTILGHSEDFRSVQAPFYSQLGVDKKPDYSIFQSNEDKIDAITIRETDTDKFFDKVILLVEAKKWGTDLDKGTKETPSLQIKRYLRLTHVRWGILTNGRKWRIYYEGSSFSSNIFLEFNLESMILQKDYKLFKYFLLFFGHHSFTRERGKSILDLVLEQNHLFTQKVTKALGENVYDALKVLVEGFLKFEKNRFSEKDLEKIHKNSLILLYRLLFCFYAESKGVIKFTTKTKMYSLLEISKELEEDQNIYAPLDDSYWFKLQRTFNLINNGSMKVLGTSGISPYNGGLFDPEKHAFLDNYKIGNNFLKEAIILLIKRRKKNKTYRVDYETLRIKHLGTIYEKLLEYQLKIAKKDLKLEENKYSEATNDSEIVVKKGDLYYITDKGERRETGSYYTPDYIVQFIIEKSIGKLIQERCARARENQTSEAKEILTLKILDPAMGSGHFLVAATEFMAEKLIAAINRDVQNGIGDDKKRDIYWAKRRIVRNCIYGIDLNPLSTELAKVSLWLSTVSVNKPLSFLDIRLKVGNSLLGIDYDKLDSYPKNHNEKHPSKTILNPTIIKDMLQPYQEILDIKRDNLKTIELEERYYKKFQNHKYFHKLKCFSNVYISYFYDNKFSIDNFEILRNSLDDEKVFSNIQDKAWFKKGIRIARKKGFFHWFLEFPNIFFDVGKGTIRHDAGFDVILGNPPYNLEYTDNDKEFIREIFKYSGGNLNSANQFIEIAKKYSKDIHSMVVPKSLCFSSKWETVRSFLIDDLKIVADCSRAFKDVLLEQIVYVSVSSKQNSFVKTLKLHHEGVKDQIDIEKSFFKRIGTWSTGVNEKEIDIAKRFLDRDKYFSDISNIERGLYKKNLVSNEGKYPIYRGNCIEKYFLKPSEEFLTQGKYEKYKNELDNQKTEKVIIQNIIAHVENPVDHIILMGVVDEERIFTKNNVGNITLKENHGSHDLYSLCALFQSSLVCWYLYKFIYTGAIRTMRYDEIDLKRTPLNDDVWLVNQISNSSKALHSSKKDINKLNLDLNDYLINYDMDTKTLSSIYQPIRGLSDTIFSETTIKKKKLRFGNFRLKEENEDLVLLASARYKPKESVDLKVDRYGYTETDLIPIIRFDLTERDLRNLIKIYIPYVLSNPMEFSSVKIRATKTISLIDRLDNIKLPKLEDVKLGIQKYLRVKEKFDRLQCKITNLENSIETLALILYEVKPDEIDMILNSLGYKEQKRRNIRKLFEDYTLKMP